MGDEGIGVRVVEQLAKDASSYPDVDFKDAGAAGWALLHVLDGRRKAILVDCAFMGEMPGTMRRFEPQKIRSMKNLAGFSLHEGDLVKILDVAEGMGVSACEVVLYGIQPERVEPGLELSPRLAALLPEYVRRVAEELQRDFARDSMGRSLPHV